MFLALPGALKTFQSYAIQPSTMPQIPIQDIVFMGVSEAKFHQRLVAFLQKNYPGYYQVWTSDLCYRNVKFTPNMMIKTPDKLTSPR
jgi:hypothetical protein